MEGKHAPVKGVVGYKPGKAFKGYTLFCQTHEGPRLGHDLWAYIRLMDMSGAIMHEWRVNTAVQLSKLQPDGTLYYMTRDRSRIAEAGIYQLAPDGSVIWRYHCRADHDFFPLENGNMVIHTITDHMEPRLGSGLRRHPYFVEITRDKELVWEWHGEDHVDELMNLVGLEMPLDWDSRAKQEVEQRGQWDKRLASTSAEEKEQAKRNFQEGFSFDWAHNNTCQVIGENAAAAEDGRFRPGNIVFSYRTLDIIGVIDKDSGEIVWAWGPGEIEGQHKPHMLSNGHILIFDNGTRRGWSRVLEVDPLVNEITWEYVGEPKESFFSPAISGAQRLANDNTLICEGGPGHDYFGHVGRLLEVTPEKEIVWEFRTPYRGFIFDREVHNIYRANRYTEEYVAPLLGD